jgi:demethylmenaquinone methyltransferase/2-methoxy-6-polyprenyl-1,4-benzoquinol methylase
MMKFLRLSVLRPPAASPHYHPSSPVDPNVRTSMRQADPSSSAAAWTATDLRSNPHEAPDKAARVRRMFAAIARRYDLNNRLHSFGRDQAWRRWAVALCEVQPTDDVLDVACGTGDLTQAFAAAGPKSVTGLDFTPEMLEIAREKAQRWAFSGTGVSPVRISNGPSHALPVSEWIEHDSPGRDARATVPQYVQGDAMSLPFADGSFDIVSIAWGIRNVANPEKALREFRRVLRPGGRLCVLEFSEPRSRLLRSINRLYCGHIMPLTATLIARDRSGAYRYLPQSIATFTDSKAFARLIEESGFPRPALHPLTFGVCTVYVSRLSA